MQRLTIRVLKYQFKLVYVPLRNFKVPDILRKRKFFHYLSTEYLESNVGVFAVMSTSKENEVRVQEVMEED